MPHVTDLYRWKIWRGKNSILHWFIDVKTHLSKFTRELIGIDRRMMTGGRRGQGSECDYYYYISHNTSSFNNSNAAFNTCVIGHSSRDPWSIIKLLSPVSHSHHSHWLFRYSVAKYPEQPDLCYMCSKYLILDLPDFWHHECCDELLKFKGRKLESSTSNV